MGKLRSAGIDFVRNMEHARIIRGRMGKRTANGYEYQAVPGYSIQYTYVTRETTTGVAVGVVIALNTGAPKIGGYPVVLDKSPEDEWLAMADYQRAAQFMGRGLPLNAVAPHSHRLGLGLDDLVEGLRFEPGLVAAHDGLTVYIYPFAYIYGQEEKYWPGGTVNVSAHVPDTAGRHRWVKVGINPATNTATTTAGTTYPTGFDLGQNLLAAIDFGDYIPCGGVKVKYGQTSFKRTDFGDPRFHIGAAAGSYADDLLAWIAM